MNKRTALLLLLVYCCAAAPTSEPAAFDGNQCALAMAGMYHPEEGLLKEAVDPSFGLSVNKFATVAAIVNEWRGPFRVHEFSLWLRKNGLAGRVSVSETEMNMQRFRHLPESCSQVSLSIAGKPNDDGYVAASMAVPPGTRAEEIQAILDDPKEDGTGQTPIAYSIEVYGFPGTYPGSKEMYEREVKRKKMGQP